MISDHKHVTVEVLHLSFMYSSYSCSIHSCLLILMVVMWQRWNRVKSPACTNHQPFGASWCCKSVCCFLCSASAHQTSCTVFMWRVKAVSSYVGVHLMTAASRADRGQETFCCLQSQPPRTESKWKCHPSYYIKEYFTVFQPYLSLFNSCIYDQ